ncbi:hypothetical protein [Amycolatopsis sp. NPDC051372]|uniref:hypothetical protein n=1 Tax=unclassified Amycolatopsis TaxID=2618356 RepID=UPI0034489686
MPASDLLQPALSTPPRIHDDVQKLLYYEDVLQRRRDYLLAAAEDAARRAREAKPPVDDRLVAGGAFAVIRLIVSYLTWGSRCSSSASCCLIMGAINLVDGVQKTLGKDR